MLRCFCLAAALSVALTPLLTKVAFSRPLSPRSQYPEVQNSRVDLPICYIQTADGRTVDLQRLCGKTSPLSNTLSRGVSRFKFRQGSGSGYASDSL